MRHTPGPWYTTTKSDDRQGLVIAETTGNNIAVTYDPQDAALIAAAPEMLGALRYAEQSIRQLCDLINTQAGRRKVRFEDFADRVTEAIAK